MPRSAILAPAAGDIAGSAVEAGGRHAALLRALLLVAWAAKDLALSQFLVAAYGRPTPHAMLDLRLRVNVVDLKFLPRSAANAGAVLVQPIGAVPGLSGSPALDVNDRTLSVSTPPRMSLNGSVIFIAPAISRVRSASWCR